MPSDFKTPDWCAPPSDKQIFVLQVLKDKEVLESHRIQKGCFFFGRNSDQVDYVLNHASCSRVHAVLVFNPLVERFFLNDFGSANGSFIEKRQKPLQANHLEYIPFEVTFRFGASTRSFRIVNHSDSASSDLGISGGQSTGLNEKLSFDEETQRNTILNQNITVKERDSDDKDDDSSAPGPRAMPAHIRSKSVSFSETVDFINLHEIDENVGQFGDLARTSFNPKKRKLNEEEQTADVKKFPFDFVSDDHAGDVEDS